MWKSMGLWSFNSCRTSKKFQTHVGKSGADRTGLREIYSLHVFLLQPPAHSQTHDPLKFIIIIINLWIKLVFFFLLLSLPSLQSKV